jgi:hypothetical protein
MLRDSAGDQLGSRAAAPEHKGNAGSALATIEVAEKPKSSGKVSGWGIRTWRLRHTQNNCTPMNTVYYARSQTEAKHRSVATRRSISP